MSEGARGAPAQRVVDQAGDRGAVARAGEAMREAPVLQRVGRRPAARSDIGENLDGGGKPRAPASWQTEQDAHDEDRATSTMQHEQRRRHRHAAAQAARSLLVTCTIGMQRCGSSTNIQASTDVRASRRGA